MSSRTILIIGVIVLGAGGLAVLQAHDLRLPGDHRGYEPEQPIAFSHSLHAGEMQIACLYCHADAERSRHAGIPSAGTCMNCHKFVGATIEAVRAEEKAAASAGQLAGSVKRDMRPLVSPEIEKLYDALDTRTPIRWARVHNLPDFVFFDHSRHVNGNVACESCHGPVSAMARLRQDADLSMGWCLNCHRDANTQAVAAGRKAPATLDCSACHY